MRKTLILLFLLSLSACSVVPMKSELPTEIQPGKSELYAIDIFRWGELQFSGLMGVQYNSTGLKYALLDASGVKLIEASVSHDNEFTLHFAVPMMKETKLPKYLGVWISRVLLVQPKTVPCSWAFLRSLCVNEGSMESQKSSRLGTFLVWQSKKSWNKNEKRLLYRYSHPLIGVDVNLNLLKGK